jgi:hypothetical protein
MKMCFPLPVIHVCYYFHYWSAGGESHTILMHVEHGSPAPLIHTCMDEWATS